MERVTAFLRASRQKPADIRKDLDIRKQLRLAEKSVHKTQLKIEEMYRQHNSCPLGLTAMRFAFILALLLACNTNKKDEETSQKASSLDPGTGITLDQNWTDGHCVVYGQKTVRLR